MKRVSKTLYRRAAAAAAALTLSLTLFCVSGADKEGESSSLDDLDFIEMINSVDTGKASDLIQQFQAKEAKNRLLNGRYNPKGECTVESFRNKEVLLLTIPAHLLFAPNDTTLKAGASEYLQPIKRYLRTPDMYRVLLVMHTDNTGSEVYRDHLTEERSKAVADWYACLERRCSNRPRRAA